MSCRIHVKYNRARQNGGVGAPSRARRQRGGRGGRGRRGAGQAARRRERRKSRQQGEPLRRPEEAPPPAEVSGTGGGLTCLPRGTRGRRPRPRPTPRGAGAGARSAPDCPGRGSPCLGQSLRAGGSRLGNGNARSRAGRAQSQPRLGPCERNNALARGSRRCTSPWLG